MTVPGPDYGSAAQRHLDDADHLHQHRRFANADHLAGLSAECALKAVAVTFLGVQVMVTSAPTTMINKKPKPLTHLPSLWATMSLLITGRQGSNFASLLLGKNPFDKWNIYERYDRMVAAMVPSGRSASYLSTFRDHSQQCFARNLYDNASPGEDVYSPSVEDIDAPHSPLSILFNSDLVGLDPAANPGWYRSELVRAAFSDFLSKTLDLLPGGTA